MGKMETKVRRGIRHSKINAAVIGTLSVAGVLAVGLVAPNALGALGKIGILKPYQRQSAKRSLSRLIEHGYVAIEGPMGERRVRLTKKGERYATLLGDGRLKIKKPRRWDGKWRLLIFDIPERFRKQRDQVRTTLINLGFRRLQDSVWVYPYDCEDLVALLKVDLKIGKSLLYIVADAVEYDAPLRAHFDV